MPFILGANSLAGGGYAVDNSLRFNTGSSDYLNRTPATTTNRRTFTYSSWFKRSNLGANYYLHTVDTSDADAILFETDDRLRFTLLANLYRLTTTQKLRDVSAWYHLVIAVDTTQATASNRIKMYINGSQVTAFDVETYPTQNYDTKFNSTSYVNFVSLNNGSNAFNGYMSEINFIDGQALTPTDFGEFDEDSGIWKPIPYAGTYGTNGFYLEFQDSGALGTDTSGNGNNFTVNNLTSIDQTTDTPTNNFNTMNPLDNYSVTLSNGNLTCSCASPSGIRSTFGATAGKYYAEVKYQSTTSFCGVVPLETQVSSIAISAILFGQSGGSAPELYLNGSFTSDYNSAGAFSADDIMQIALDMDSNTVYFGKNGSWFGGTSWTESTPTTGHSLTSGYTYGFRASTGSGTSVNIWNFGNPPFTIASGNSDANGFGNFEYAVPAGYLALCTANLSENL